jgi:hypothetical protein
MTDVMRILIFHARLSHLTGGEVNARDWALGLKGRGHKVVVYTLEPGPLAEQVRNAGVAVVTDPTSITDPPDIMFGCGINDVVAMLARFPEVPAIQVAQVWDHWNAYPCRLPQVALHVAVDDLNAEMVVNEFGVPREQVRIIHNAVDLTQVAARKRPLPSRPARALVFVKQNNCYMEAVRSACAARNITADFFGYPIGSPIHDPLRAIADYDLVVGAARTALEGAIGGAAVLVADHRGLAGLLTTANVDRYRKDNFGREVLTRPVDVATIGTEIDAYDPIDAAAVSILLREEGSLERQLDKWEEVFAEAIDRFRRAPPTAEDSRKALSAYLSCHLPRPWEPSPGHMRFRGGLLLQEQIGALEARISESERQISKTAEQVVATDARLRAVEAGTAQRTTAIDARAALLAEQIAATDARVSLLAEQIAATDARASLLAAQIAATDARASLLAEQIAATDARAPLLAEQIAATDARASLLAEQIAATDARTSLLAEQIAATDARLTPIRDMVARNAPLLRLFRPFAIAVRKFPWAGIWR